jgi:predicted ribosomally synthesized peptide with SipW-like signal peptide
MTKTKSTKRALLMSALALLVCVSMLIGSTFAWFTDSVTSASNIIKSGDLEIEMQWKDATALGAQQTYIDASQGPIFNYDKWEPGYVEAKNIKIFNKGNLDFKYQMRILANGVVSILADVIDVYYFDSEVTPTRADCNSANCLGTLKEVLNVTNANNISKVIAGDLLAGKDKAYTIALKMKESAGNEYQNLSIGANFSIQILATQLTSESDSFGNTYDAQADFAPQETPAATVYALSPETLKTISVNGEKLDTGYSFQPTETYDQSLESEYCWAHADFFVYSDATVPANSMALAGYYNAFNGFSIGGQTLSPTNWIGLTANVDVKAGEANGVRLLADGMSGTTIAYNEICNYGNDGTGFLCGATDVTGQNAGTTLTVELRLYKAECTNAGCHHNKLDCETGEYITVGKFTYTFGGEYKADSQGAVYFHNDNGEVVLDSVEDVTAANYTVMEGTTAIDGGVFADNSNITSVVIPATVTDFGATGVSATNASNGAFKDSNVTSVVLADGTTEIPAAAFNGAKKLTSVTIPETVEKIGVNAFRSTALTELTIPASVKEISYGAFRDMLSLNTVTINGDNVTLPGYVFRGCSALRTVNLNMETLTLNGSMNFANASSNNPNTNNITFNVKNETVANTVKAHMGVGSYVAINVNGSLYAEIK